MSDFEKPVTSHHLAPWLPTNEEAALCGNNRVRMACPDQGENLTHRYWRVLAGFRGIGFTNVEYLAGFDFEHALADLLACEHCEATFSRSAKLFEADHNPLELRIYKGCRTVTGQSQHFDLHRQRTEKEGRPVFVVFNCHGPIERLAEIREVFAGQRAHDFGQPLIPDPGAESTRPIS